MLKIKLLKYKTIKEQPLCPSGPGMSPKNVGQLTKIIGISQSGISKHLNTLRDWDFVDGFKNGKQVTYKLNKGYIRKLLNNLLDLIKK